MEFLMASLEIRLGMNERIAYLSALAGEKRMVIYNIHFCRAGVGIQYAIYNVWDNTDNENYSLHTDRYYPTIEDCIEGEIERLTKG